jgi:hypothetical protein
MYRFLRLMDPMIRASRARGAPGTDGLVDLKVAGRQSGRPRMTLLTLLSVGEEQYVGHPNGDTQWTRNVEEAGVVDIDPPGVYGGTFSAVRLPPGPERDAVIKATRTQQPFPANVVYRAAFRHIAAVGVYFRLVPMADNA